MPKIVPRRLGPELLGGVDDGSKLTPQIILHSGQGCNHVGKSGISDRGPVDVASAPLLGASRRNRASRPRNPPGH